MATNTQSATKPISSFNVNHPACILKILLYSCETTADPFRYARISPDFFDAIEPDVASAVVTKFGNITSLPAAFLRRTKQTTTFDARFLHSVKFIGTACLAWSQSLVVLDLSSTTCFPANVTEISDSCFVLLSALEVADFSGMQSLEKIGDRFLADCGQMHTCKINFPKVKKIGANFLAGSSSLKTFDVSSLVSLDNKTPAWFLNKSGIKSLTGLEKMKRCEKIENGFCSECMNLEQLDLSFLANAKEIGAMFCYWCRALTTVHVSSSPQENQENFFSEITEIGYSFLETSGLTIIPNESFLHKLTNVRKIEKGFLRCCNELKKTSTIDLSKMVKLDAKEATVKSTIDELKGMAVKNEIQILLPAQF